MNFLNLFNKNGKKDSGFNINDIISQWPYEIVVVPGDKAMDTWHKLRIEGKDKYCPVIIGKPKNIKPLSFSIKENTFGRAHKYQL